MDQNIGSCPQSNWAESRTLAGMRRTPRYHSYLEMLADAEGLAANGYERAGNWSLGQVCRHLTHTMEKSLDGFPGLKPWPFRLAARTFVLGGILQHRQHKRRFPAPGYLLPADGEDDRTGLDALRSVVGRLMIHKGELHPHPIFGRLTPSQWHEVHLWHAEHHLSFLVPKNSPAATT
jgi:Protein of unknown function (DUF1569)